MFINKPRNKRDLYNRVLRGWYKSERARIRLTSKGEQKRLKYIKLRQEFQYLLDLWEGMDKGSAK